MRSNLSKSNWLANPVNSDRTMAKTTKAPRPATTTRMTGTSKSQNQTDLLRRVRGFSSSQEYWLLGMRLQIFSTDCVILATSMPAGSAAATTRHAIYTVAG
jgi:hypothetical protein